MFTAAVFKAVGLAHRGLKLNNWHRDLYLFLGQRPLAVYLSLAVLLGSSWGLGLR
jgi:hypothetical protein